MIDAVTDSIDQIAAEEVGRRAVALDEVIAARFTPLVVTVQIRPLLEQGSVTADKAVHLDKLFDGDPAVGMGSGFPDQIDDDLVQRVGRLRALIDVEGLGIARQAAIALDHIDDAVEPGTGA